MKGMSQHNLPCQPVLLFFVSGLFTSIKSLLLDCTARKPLFIFSIPKKISSFLYKRDIFFEKLKTIAIKKIKIKVFLENSLYR